MSKTSFQVKAKIFIWPTDQAAWHFVYIPKEQSEKIQKAYKGVRRGFGAVPVEITLGKATWKTSVFPDKKSGCYLLPLKADVRKKEDVMEGDTILFSLKIKV